MTSHFICFSKMFLCHFSNRPSSRGVNPSHTMTYNLIFKRWVEQLSTFGLLTTPSIPTLPELVQDLVLALPYLNLLIPWTLTADLSPLSQLTPPASSLVATMHVDSPATEQHS